MIETLKRSTHLGWHWFGLIVAVLALVVHGGSLAYKIFIYFSPGSTAQMVDLGTLMIVAIKTAFIPPVVYMFFWLCGRLTREPDPMS
jgi:hypothetical protein